MSGTPYTALEAAAAAPGLIPQSAQAIGPGVILTLIALAFLFIAIEALHNLFHRRNPQRKPQK